jgi:hypothetical protein
MKKQSGITNPLEGSGIHEYHYIMSDGVKVIYKNIGGVIVKL